MFLRHWSGLPEDPKFPCDLEKLGYFVNDIDEIRNIEDPNSYFKFFLNHNERVNECQGFAFDTAIQDIIHARLEKEGLEKIPLPLGTPSEKPHVPIFASTDVGTKSRVIVIFGDTSQMLGALAMRIANGRGGIDKGSLVSIVREIKKQRCSPDDKDSPGIIIANPSELWWWPEGKRALDIPRRNRVPMTSAVHLRRLDDDRVNTIPKNETPLRHTEYMFKHIFEHLIREDAKIDIIGIGHGSDPIEKFLGREEHWTKYAAHRLNSLVLLGGYSKFDDEPGQEFKEFLERRGRVYLTDNSPVDTCIANSNGNPKYPAFVSFGCPVYSAGACDSLLELIFVEAHSAILGWLQRVSDTPSYCNDPNVAVLNPVQAISDENDEAARKRAWEGIPVEERPCLGFMDDEVMQKEMRFARGWLRYEKTGEFVASDEEEE